MDDRKNEQNSTASKSTSEHLKAMVQTGRKLSDIVRGEQSGKPTGAAASVSGAASHSYR